MFNPLEAQREFERRCVRFLKWPLGTGGLTPLTTTPPVEGVASGSLKLMVPAARLYSRVTTQVISSCQRQGSSVRVEGDLRKEILQWRFVNTWTGCVP